MKIEIVTIHRLNNFGSVFQAFALYQFLKDSGYEVEILDYHPKYYKGNKIRNFIGRLIYRKDLTIREAKFDRFIDDYMKVSTNRFSIKKDVCKHYPKADIYIAGGDQLWNYHHACGNDDIYKLVFFDGIKVSYGTSLGGHQFNEEQLEDLKSKLASFQCISVRESKSVKLLETLNITANWVVDPVLLLDSSRYDKMMIKPNFKESYVFVYLVEPSKVLNETVRYLTEVLKLKIIVFSGFAHKCKCDLQERNIGPEEVIGYIKNASFVLSSSFHATLFSIMFHVKFAVILPGYTTNERLLDLLEWTNMEEKIIYKDTDIKQIYGDKKWYDETLARKIEVRTAASKRWLLNAIATHTEG